MALPRHYPGHRCTRPGRPRLRVRRPAGPGPPAPAGGPPASHSGCRTVTAPASESLATSNLNLTHKYDKPSLMLPWSTIPDPGPWRDQTLQSPWEAACLHCCIELERTRRGVTAVCAGLHSESGCSDPELGTVRVTPAVNVFVACSGPPACPGYYGDCRDGGANLSIMMDPTAAAVVGRSAACVLRRPGPCLRNQIRPNRTTRAGDGRCCF